MSDYVNMGNMDCLPPTSFLSTRLTWPIATYHIELSQAVMLLVVEGHPV